MCRDIFCPTSSPTWPELGTSSRWSVRFQPRASGTTPTATEPTKISLATAGHPIQSFLRFLVRDIPEARIKLPRGSEADKLSVLPGYTGTANRHRLRNGLPGILCRIHPSHTPDL